MTKEFLIISAIALSVSCGGGTSNQKAQNTDSAQVSIVSTETETETDTPVGESIIYALGDINKDGIKDSVSIYGEKISDDKELSPLAKGMKVFLGKGDGKYSLFNKSDIYSLKENFGFENDEDYARNSKFDSLSISLEGDLTVVFSVGMDGLSTFSYKSRLMDNDMKIILFEYMEDAESSYSFVCDFLKKEIISVFEDHCVDSEEYHTSIIRGALQFDKLFSFSENPIGKAFRMDYESEKQSSGEFTYKDAEHSNLMYVNVTKSTVQTNGCNMMKVFKQLERKSEDTMGEKKFKDEGVYAYYSLTGNDGEFTRVMHSYEFDSGEKYLVLDFYNHEITAYICKNNVLTKTELPAELQPFNNAAYKFIFDDKDGYAFYGHKIDFVKSAGDTTVLEWRRDKFEFVSGPKPQSTKVDLHEIWKKIIAFSSEEDMEICGDCWPIEYHEDAPIPYFEQLSSKGANLGELYCFQVKDGYKIYYVDNTTDDGFFLYTFEYKNDKITLLNDDFSLEDYKEFGFIEGGKVFRAWKKTDGFDDYLWNGETLVKK